MARRKPTDPNLTRDAELLAIAQRQFRIETLETQSWDRLDFHDVAVWAIRAALEEAFEAGRRTCRRGSPDVWLLVGQPCHGVPPSDGDAA